MADSEIKLIVRAIREGRGLEEIKSELANVKDQTEKTGGSVNQLTGFFKGLLPALGAAALVAGIKSIADSAMESEKESRILAQTIKNVGLEGQTTVEEIQSFATSLQNLAGVSDEEVIRSFNNLLKVTKDEKQSMELTKLAMDMAAGSGKELFDVTNALEKLMLGNARGMREFGIETKDGASTMDILRRATELYNGQAEKLGASTEGSIRKAGQAFDNLKETAGAAFLPLLGWLADVATKVIQLGSVFIANTIINFKELGNVAKALFSTLKGDFGAWNKMLEENAKLEQEKTKNTLEVYKKSTDEKKKLQADLTVFNKNQYTTDGANYKKEQEELAKIKKEHDDKVKQMEEELHKEIERQNKVDYEARKAYLDAHYQDYQKVGVDKKLLDEWYAGENRKIQEESVKKYRDDIQEIVKLHTVDLLEGVRKGNLDVSSFMQNLIDDIVGRWEQGIAQMVADWVTSDLMRLPSPASGGGTGVGGASRGGVSGAVSGAGKGAAIGSVVPVVGNIVGGAIGAIGGFFGLWGQGGKFVANQPGVFVAGEKGPEEITVKPLGGGKTATANTGATYNINVSVGAFMGTDADAMKFAKLIKYYIEKIDRREITV